MKKGLVIAALCFVAMIVALPLACIEVDAEKESMKVTEEVISGNPKAAEGVKLSLATHWKGHMLWNTEYTVGSGEIINEFEFVSNDVSWGQKSTEKINIDYVANIGSVNVTGGSDRQPEVDLEGMWLSKITMAVAERTAPGTTHTETVCLADYYEYYPLSLHVSSNVRRIYYYNDCKEDGFTELFHIGTSEEDIFDISITKDVEGIVRGFEIKRADGALGLTTEDAEAFGEKGCYYTYACTDWNTGEYIERGENRGIFYMPYEKDDNRTTISADRAKKVCELENGIIPVNMFLDEEKGMLYLLTRDGEKYEMYVYKLNGYVPELADSLVVLEDDGRSSIAGISVEDGGVFIKSGDNRFAFITEENGEYSIWCDNVFPKIEDNWDVAFPEEHALLFDGERLVLAALKNWYGTDIQLAVYSREGQEYYGIYHHSSSVDDMFYEKFENEKIIPQGGTGGLSRANGVKYVPIWLSE